MPHKHSSIIGRANTRSLKQIPTITPFCQLQQHHELGEAPHTSPMAVGGKGLPAPGCPHKKLWTVSLVRKAPLSLGAGDCQPLVAPSSSREVLDSFLVVKASLYVILACSNQNHEL
eukprot:c23810_g2_i1 orf=96-443(+)